MKITELILKTENLPMCVRQKMRKLAYMEQRSGEFKGVKWRSLSPTSMQIRVKDIERLCKRTRKGVGELYPEPGELNMILNKPVLREKFYNRTRQRVI